SEKISCAVRPLSAASCSSASSCSGSSSIRRLGKNGSISLNVLAVGHRFQIFDCFNRIKENPTIGNAAAEELESGRPFMFGQRLIVLIGIGCEDQMITARHTIAGARTGDDYEWDKGRRPGKGADLLFMWMRHIITVSNAGEAR